ncbi:MAG: alpha-ketoglutarate-dependent dioxygenase AlkB [Terrestrivirus sp.]|jgi:alkylated DNA repair dioxygenase AlkB|uniref:Alpha-ketoglutarate-dependent dioxygenase AlkB n=1 Tax=Terrestrivirus sp. TaxID=2487775 RepID=A0A3G4ZPA2_9VIRU|nr:MAG: alpha-ketoglutarate-dependent dioxygenase AlkB [Terrestrivirus sp.]
MEINGINGLHLYRNLLSHQQSIDTIQKLDGEKWVPLSLNKKSRKVQHYGFYYNYTTYNINEKAPDMPNFIITLRDLLTTKCKELGLIDDTYVFNQCIVNNYECGEGISPHTDLDKFGPVIGCFTLGSGALMKFTKGDMCVDLYTEDRSLYIMSGEARSIWKHQMPQQSYDTIDGIKIKRGRRISVTFRNVP